MNNIKQFLNLKILNIVEKLNNNKKENIINYIDNEILNLDIKFLKKTNNNVKDKLIYLLENDTNFLILSKNLKNIELFLKNECKIETNEDEINDIIINYLESNL